MFKVFGSELNMSSANETFNCVRCDKPFSKTLCVVIKECSHKLCKKCFNDHCMYSSKKYSSVRCPQKACTCPISEDEIKRHLGVNYGKYFTTVAQRQKQPEVNVRCSKCNKKTASADCFQTEKCFHIFCKKCIIKHCHYSSTKYVEVRCPTGNCQNVLNESEIRALLGNNYNEYSFKVIQRLKENKTTECDNGGSESAIFKRPAHGKSLREKFRNEKADQGPEFSRQNEKQDSISSDDQETSSDSDSDQNSDESDSDTDDCAGTSFERPTSASKNCDNDQIHFESEITQITREADSIKLVHVRSKKNNFMEFRFMND